METAKEKTCLGLPHFCSAGQQAPKPAIQPEIKRTEPVQLVTASSSKQKPWSVFGDVYWI